MAAGPFLFRIASVLVSAQTGQFIIRPHAYVPGAQFDNPDWAYEDPNTKSSVKTIYRRCGTICTTPDSATTTWLGVPDGYEPTSLEVNWHATASLAGPYGGDAATMTAKIEYSLDNGQGWTVLEQVTWMANSPSCTNHGITCNDHVVSVPLLSTQSTGAIQVRGTLTAQMTHCDVCQLRISSILALIAVSDIRIKVQPLVTVSTADIVSDQIVVTLGPPGVTHR